MKMNRETRKTLLRIVTAYANAVASALESGPPPQAERLWADLEACEILIRFLMPAPVPLQGNNLAIVLAPEPPQFPAETLGLAAVLEAEVGLRAAAS